MSAYFWPQGTDPAHALTVIAEACEENRIDWANAGCDPSEAIAFAEETGKRVRDVMRLLSESQQGTTPKES